MRLSSITTLLLSAIAMVVFAAVGCDNPSKSKTGSPTTKHDEHDTAGNDHDDHPAHGPNGGHLFELDSPDYQGEWKKYSDNDIIRMYLLDAAGKNAAPLKVESFIVTPLVGNDDVQFDLVAEEPDENGASAVYMLDDKDLAIAIPLGTKIAIKVGDKTLQGQIKAHKPLDH